MPSDEEKGIAQELDVQFGTGLADIEKEPFQEQLPPGNYAFRIKNAYLNRSGQTNRKQLIAPGVVLETDAGDELVGKPYSKVWGLENEQNLKYFKRDMEALELPEPKTSADILTLCTLLVGKCFQAILVANKEEQYPPNCYLNKGARRKDLETGDQTTPTNF